MVDDRVVLPENTFLEGNYRIQRTIGEGGFGITYEAVDVGLQTKVAIKEYFPTDFGARDAKMSVRAKSQRHKQTFEWGRSSFLQEAQTLARFRHPSIVRVTRVFEALSTAYMVMDFEQGKSFELWLRDLGRAPTQDELDRLVAPLLEALELMHAQSFLHRDIAPDNILIRADGTPVLLDFGAARRAVAEMSHAITGIVKEGYSPHEQYSSDGRLQGPWTDIYALGGTLYRAVVGRAPEGAALRIDKDEMQSAAHAATGECRPDFLQAIDACLKTARADRPQSISQLRPLLFAKPNQAKVSSILPGEAHRLARRWHLPVLAVLAGTLLTAYGWYEYAGWRSREHIRTEADAARAALEGAANTRKEEAEKKSLAEQELARRRAEEDALRIAAESEEKRKADDATKRQAEAKQAQERAAPPSRREPIDQQAKKAAAIKPEDRFDGAWAVTISCPKMADGVLAYSIEFVAEIKNGVLYGQHGVKNKPNSRTLEGKFQADGTILIRERGLTGSQPAFAAGRPPPGTSYSADLLARFEGASGAGKRVTGRACDIAFAKL